MRNSKKVYWIGSFGFTAVGGLVILAVVLVLLAISLIQYRDVIYAAISH